MIADVVDKKDVTRLRLVCKQLNANTIRRYVKEFIEDIPIMISNKSLRALRDIAKHPVFGPQVRCITISTRFLHDDTTCECKTCLAPLSFDEEIHEAMQTGNVEMGEDWCPSRTVNHRFAEQECLKSTRKARNTLIIALNELKVHGQMLSFSVTDNILETIGFKSFWKDIEDFYDTMEDHTVWYLNRTFVLGMIIDAVSTSMTILKGLNFTVGDISADWPYQDFSETRMESGELATERLGFRKTADVCSQLQTVSLKCLYDPDETDLAMFLSIEELLSSCTQATSFRIEYGMFVYEPVGVVYGARPHRIRFHTLQSGMASSKLSVLELSDVLGGESDFIELLRKHAPTMRCLSLQGCALSEGGSWRRLLGWILENLSLEQIMVERMIIGPGEDDYDNETDPVIRRVSPRLLSAKGTNQVRKCLEEGLAILKEAPPEVTEDEEDEEDEDDEEDEEDEESGEDGESEEDEGDGEDGQDMEDEDNEEPNTED